MDIYNTNAVVYWSADADELAIPTSGAGATGVTVTADGGGASITRRLCA